MANNFNHLTCTYLYLLKYNLLFMSAIIEDIEKFGDKFGELKIVIKRKQKC